MREQRDRENAQTGDAGFRYADHQGTQDGAYPQQRVRDHRWFRIPQSRSIWQAALPLSASLACTELVQMANLYEDTAEPAAPAPALEGDARADVAVVGGGITGLSTALHLAELGAKVVVLEAEQPGWGASGRNGGQVNPGLEQ